MSASALLRHGGVREAVVVAQPEPSGGKRLVGFVVAAEEPGPGSAVLRELLRQSLPEHMVPALLVELASLPLTPNGKVDRKALPKVNGSTAAPTEFIAPDTPTEKALAALWQVANGLDRDPGQVYELGA